MNDRRRVLKKLPIAILGSSAVLTGALMGSKTPAAEKRAVIDTGKKDAFPDVMLTSHHGQEYRFYDDLVHDKINLISLMSIRGESAYPVTANLGKVAKLLHEKMGKEVFINSVTRDPEHDTPEKLRRFAHELGVGDIPGWQFLTSSQHVSDALTTRLYRHEHRSEYDSESLCAVPDFQRKVDIVFYGNGGIGLWGTFPALIEPQDAVERIGWVTPSSNLAGSPRRAGPRKLTPADTLSHNRVV